LSTTMPPDLPVPSPGMKPRRRRRAILVVVAGVTASIALGWAFVARATSLRVYVIPSVSMMPTLQPGDKVCADERPGLVPKRGELWLFTMPPSAAAVPSVAIKRVVGLPGDTIKVEAGKVWIDGEALDEPYLAAPIGYTLAPRTLGPGEYFMLGDSRNGSFDSHLWGPLPSQRLIGRAIYRVWPLRRAGGL
jgi:signal peptidase I